MVEGGWISEMERWEWEEGEVRKGKFKKEGGEVWGKKDGKGDAGELKGGRR